jgi:hypothetical protein
MPEEANADEDSANIFLTPLNHDEKRVDNAKYFVKLISYRTLWLNLVTSVIVTSQLRGFEILYIIKKILSDFSKLWYFP